MEVESFSRNDAQLTQGRTSGLGVTSLPSSVMGPVNLLFSVIFGKDSSDLIRQYR
jgi:hypothetical protein